MKRSDALIFDLDGVLIDVSESYRRAIRQTVQAYLERVVGLPPSGGELVSHEDVAALKLAGGFNNDWDLTTGIVAYFVAMLDGPDLPGTSLSKTREGQKIAVLRATGKPVTASVETLRQGKDIPTFAQAVRAQGGGLEAVRKILGERIDRLLAAEGDPRGMGWVKRIFEEIYLGEEQFRADYGEPPRFCRDEGLIRRERLIPDVELVSTLSHHFAFGVATGRPRRKEAYTVDAARIAAFFRALVAREDIVEAEQAQFAATGARVHLGKPHPFSLLEAARRITTKRARCAYVGDTLDDVRAANAAKAEMDFVSIGCLASADDKPAMRREFEGVGADRIVDDLEELRELTAF